MKKHLQWMLLLMAFCVPWVTHAQTTFTCDFESGDDGWSFINQSGCGWYVGTAEGGSNGGSYGLYVSTDAGATWDSYLSSTVVFAYHDVTVSAGTTVSISYAYRCHGETPSYDYMRVFLAPASATLTAGSLPSGAGASSLPTGWIALDGGGQLNGQVDWTTKSLADVAVTTGGAYRLVFMFRSDSGTEYGAPAVDNIVFTYTEPSCLSVTGLQNTYLSADAATFEWNGVSTATLGYQWLLLPADGAADWDDATTTAATQVSSASAGVELESNTNYVFYVRTHCTDDEYGDVIPMAFRTECGARTISADEPYFEGFEGGSIPDCWKTAGTVSAYNYSPYEGSYCLRIGGSSSNYAVMPAISNIGSMRVNFYAYYASYYDYGKLTVGYVTAAADPAGTFTALRPLNEPDYRSYALVPNINLGDVPEGSLIAFKHEPSSNYSYWYIDNITVEPLPDCVEPSDVVASAIGTNEATIGWTDNYEGHQWEVQYRATGDDDWTNGGVIDDNPTTLSSLTANTEYEVQVRAVCNGSDYSEWTNTIAFHTECEARTISADEPYFEGFEGGSIPDCWKTEGNVEINTYSSRVYAGSYSLRFSGRGTNYAVMPAIDEIGNMRISFYANIESTSSSGTLTVGYVTDAADPAGTFTTLVTLASSVYTSYNDFSAFNLTLVPEGARIAFRQETTGNYWWWIDNITVEPIPTCLDVTNVQAVAVGSDYFELSYVDGNETPTDNYEIAYGPAATFDLSDDNTYTVTTTTDREEVYVGTNVDAYTAYTVAVRAVCSASDKGAWSNPINIVTMPDCGEQTGRIFTMGDAYSYSSSYPFYSYTNSWNPTSYTYGGSWVYYTAAELRGKDCYAGSLNGIALSLYSNSEATFPVRIYAANRNIDSYSVNDTSDRTGMTIVYEGDVTFNAGGWTEIQFDEPFEYSGEGLEFFFLRTGAITATVYFNYENTTSDYRTVYGYGSTEQLGSYTHTNYRPLVRFTMCVSEPECLAPVNLAATGVTSNEAVINWTNRSDATSWQLQYGEDVIDIAADEVVMEGDAVSYTLSGLAANTDYTVQVRSLCDDYSEWTSAIAFHTECEARTISADEPYFEGFEGGSIPDCWKTEGNVEINTYSSRVYAGSYSLRFSGRGTNYAVMPAIDEIGNMRISFYANIESTSSSGTLTVGYVTDAADPAGTFQELYTLTSTSSSYVLVPTVYLTNVPDGARIAFRQVTTSSYYWWIDNITVEPLPSCLPVAGLAVDEVATEQATLTWSHYTGARPQTYLVEYSSGGIVIDTARIASADVTEGDANSIVANLPGLTANTAYSVRVAAMCQPGDTSEWTSTVAFRTECGIFGLPYSTGFEYADQNGSTYLPYCWNRINSNEGQYPRYSYGSANTGSYALTFQTSASAPTDQIAVMPQIDEESFPLLDNRIVFYAKASAEGASIQVGTLTDPTDASTFVVADNITLGTTYTKYKVRFENNAYGSYPALKVNPTEGSATVTVYVDDITLEEQPGCENPEGFARTAAATSQSVALTWTDEEGASWQIERTYTLDGESHRDSVVVNSEDVSNEEGVISHTLDGLVARANYSLRLRTICGVGDTSAWYDGTVTFTTQNNATDITSFAITSDDVQLGDAVIDNETHTVTVDVRHGQESFPLDGHFTLSQGANADTNGTTFPTTFSNVEFGDGLQINVTAQDNNFTQLWTVILVPETCARPMSLDVTDRQRYQISVEWDPDNSGESNSFQLYCSDSPLDAANLAEADLIDVTLDEGDLSEYTFTGLNRSTTYHIYVRTVCDDENYSGWVYTSATTRGLNDCVQVGEGTSSDDYYTPIGTYYNYSFTEQLYTAQEIGTRGSITSIAFQYVSTTAKDFPITVFMKHTDAANLSDGFVSLQADDQVFSGTLSVTGPGWATITLDSPFEYDGTSNVLVAVDKDYLYYYSGSTWAHSTAANMARYLQNDNNDYDPFEVTGGTVISNRPNIQFCFTNEACPAPAISDVSLVGDGTNTASVSWTAAEGDFANTYDVLVVPSNSTVDLENATPTYTGITALSKQLSALQAYTYYDVYVRVKCDADGYDDGYSPWSQPASFRTNSDCREPQGLTAQVTGKTSVVFSWQNGSYDEEIGASTQPNNFKYGFGNEDGSGIVLDAENDQGNDDGYTSTISYNNRQPEQTYYFSVANDCGTQGVSPYTTVAVTMPEGCRAPQNFNTIALGKYDATVAWDEDPYKGDDESYEYFLSAEQLTTAELQGLDVANITGTTAPQADLSLLQRETSYYLYVRTVCSTTLTSAWSEYMFTTAGLAYNCDETGEETVFYNNAGNQNATVASVVWENWYNNNKTQQIYTAQELLDAGLTAGMIQKVAFRFAFSNARTVSSATLSVAETELDAFANTTFVTGLDAVATATRSSFTATSGQWVEFTFDEPLYWDGTSNLLINTLWYSQWNGDRNSATFYGSTAPDYRTLYVYSDYAVDDMSTTSSGNGGARTTSRANIRFTYCGRDVACPAVDAPVVSQVTNNSAHLEWNATTADHPGTYELIVSNEPLTDFADVDPTVDAISETNYDYVGLEPETDYYVYVRAVCRNTNYYDGNSQWSPAATFRTEGNCFRPAGFDYESVGAYQATLVWSRGAATTTAWQIDTVDGEDYALMATVNADDDNVTLFGGESGQDSVRFTLAGLQPLTGYELYLKSVCDAESQSDYTASLYFTTSSDAAYFTAFQVDYLYPDGGSQMEEAAIDYDQHTVTITVMAGTDRTGLYQCFMSADGSTVTVDGEEQTACTLVDFSEPRVYRIFAEDPTVYSDWTVSVVYEACATPYDIAVTDIQRVSATLSWHVGDPDATQFYIVTTTDEVEEEELETLAETVTVEATGSDATERLLPLADLQRGTLYQVYLRNSCSDVWHQISFTTHSLDDCVQVGEGTSTTNNNPLAGWYHNSYTQQLYTADEIGNSGTITSLKFNYTSSTSTTRNITVYVGTTEESSLASGWVTPTDMTEVFHAADVTFDNSDGNWYTLTLDEPFEYTGGNLVVAMYMNYSTSETYYGSGSRFGFTNAADMARYATNDNTTPDQFTIANGVVTSATGYLSGIRPNIQFCFTSPACPDIDVTSVAVVKDNDDPTTVTISWDATDADYLDEYQLMVSETALDEVNPEEAYATTATSYQATGLTPYTDYYVYLRAVCGNDDGESSWVGPVTFRTNSACHVPEALTAELTGINSVHFSWTNDQESPFEYYYTDEALDEEALEALTDDQITAMPYDTELDLSGLEYDNPSYHLYLRHVCGDVKSPWVSVEFQTLPSCPWVTDLTVEPTFNAAVVRWTSNPFSTAESWTVTLYDYESGAETDYTTSDNVYTLVGLQPEHTYSVHVMAVCGPNPEDVSEAIDATFTTTAVPDDCVQVGEGTNQTSYAPFYTYYLRAGYTQQLYTASDINAAAGHISSLQFQFKGCSSEDLNATGVQIFMANTTATSLSSNWVNTGLTEVFNGNVAFTHGTAHWETVTLDTPFEWDGTSNIVVAVYTPNMGTDIPNYDHYFYGTAVSYMTSYVANSGGISLGDDNTPTTSGTTSYYRPNIQFCFEPEACHSVRDLAVSNITASSADVSWLPGNDEVQWNMVVSATQLDEAALADATAQTVTLVNQHLDQLVPDNDYYVYVQGVCSDEESSSWKQVAFSTAAVCSQPLTAIAEIDEYNNVHFTVTLDEEGAGTPESYDYEYWTINANGETGEPVAGNSTDVTWSVEQLPSGQLYGWRVRANCGTDDGNSRWTEGNNFYICGTIVVTEENPYIEDFTEPTRISCWDATDNGLEETNSNYTYWNLGTTSDGSIWVYNVGMYGPLTLTSPLIQLPEEGHASLSFDYFSLVVTYFTSGDYSVTVITDDEEETVWNPETVAANYEVVNESIDLNDYLGQTIRIRFTYNGENGSLWALSNMKVAMEHTYTVTALSADESKLTAAVSGEVNSQGRYYAGTGALLTATQVAEGYAFAAWVDNNGEVVSYDNPLTLLPVSDTVLTATCQIAVHTLTAAVASTQATYGSVTLDGESPAEGTNSVSNDVEYNTTHTLTAASSNAHYTFDGWYSGATLYSEENPLTITMPDENLVLRANFTAVPVVRNTVATACESWTLSKESDGSVVHTFTTSTENEMVVYTDIDENESVLINHYVTVTINHGTNTTTNEAACDSYTWTRGDASTLTFNYGDEFDEEIVYEWTNADECASYDILHLTLNQSTAYTIDEPVVACDSYTFTFGDENESVWPIPFTESNAEAQVVTTNAAGCDSTITFNLTVNHSTTFAYNDYGCDAYTWQVFEGEDYAVNETFTTVGTEEHTAVGVNGAGCDSTIVLTLTIVSSSSDDNTETVTACDSLLWQGAWRTATDTYNHEVNVGECEVTLTLNLTVVNTDHTAQSADVCDSYTWTRPDATTADFTATPETAPVYSWLATGSTDEVQCYNTDTLHLVVRHNSSALAGGNACESYTWTRGDGTEEVYTESVTEELYPYTSAEGCASVDTLRLTINHGSHSHTEATTCGEYTWEANGQVYTTTGRRYNNATTEQGCLIRDTLDLTVVSLATYTEQVTACDSIEWHDNWYYTTNAQAATYTVVGGAANGCDSVVTLNLTVNNATHNSTSTTACDSYTWNRNGQSYTESTDALYTYDNNVGCASVDTLHLTIRHSNSGDTTAVKCDGFVWYGVNRTATGDYTRTFTNVENCDSVVTLHLTINHSSTGDTTATECETFSWYGTTYTASATPTHVLTNEAGCDSTVTLNLTINNATTASVSATACVSYTWNGTTYTTSGTPTYTTTGSNGCDSTVTLNLTIVNAYTSDTNAVACEQFTWYGTDYTTSGEQSRTMQSVDGCDSVVTLHLTINHATSSEESVAACDSYTWNGTVYTTSNDATFTTVNAAGCDSTATLHLTVNYSAEEDVEVTLTDEQLPYSFNGQTFAEFGTYDVALTTVAGCDSTVHLTLVRTEGIDDNILTFVKVYPNPTSGRAQINVEQVQMVEVLDLVGRRVALFENTNTIDLSNLAAGTYTLRISMPEGTTLRKIVKR